MGFAMANIGYDMPPWEQLLANTLKYGTLRTAAEVLSATHVPYEVYSAAEGGFEEHVLALVNSDLSEVRCFKYIWRGERSQREGEYCDVNKGDGYWRLEEYSHPFQYHDRPEVVRAIREEFARRGIAAPNEGLEPFVVSV